MPEILNNKRATAAHCWTRREILQQPDTLRATLALLRDQRTAIQSFLAPLLKMPDLRIVMTGAGTSSFIGESLALWLARALGRPIEAIATTDLVSAADLYFRADRPTLLVSFGRSGNSPESVAAVDLANERLPDVHHLMITCNPAGNLACRADKRTHVVVLPDATHDRGYAMTSSFSAMVLAALSIFTGIDTMSDRVETVARCTEHLIDRLDPHVTALAALGFGRAVYLGSGIHLPLAREAALKMLELTDGKIVTLFDSALGFRHGPKTFVTNNTLVVVFVSNDPVTRKYDLDIVDELRREGLCAAVVAISARNDDDDVIEVTGMAEAADVDLLFPYAVLAQLLALQASISLGLDPDMPNTSGTVSRVVQGVRIHKACA